MPTPSSLSDAQALIASVAGRVGPAVVGLGRGWSAGSGVVVAPGRVLTVAHAVRRGEPTVAFAGGRRAEARVAGVDADANLALLEVDTPDVPAPTMAPDGDRPTLGAPVLALADPGGRGLRATLGFVTTAERSMRGVRGRRLAGVVEHSAPLPRGSSGGPLLDGEGRLVGLNAVRLDAGLVLAVPVTRARVDALARGERAEPRRLGVALAPPRVARRMRRAVGLPELDGLLVRGVQDGSPAARAGVERGDLLVGLGGRATPSLDALYVALDERADEPSLDVRVVRGTEERTLTVSFQDPAPA